MIISMDRQVSETWKIISVQGNFISLWGTSVLEVCIFIRLGSLYTPIKDFFFYFMAVLSNVVLAVS